MSTEKKEPPTAFDRFKGLASKLVAVPKKEIDRKEAAWKRRRAKRKRRP